VQKNFIIPKSTQLSRQEVPKRELSTLDLLEVSYKNMTELSD